MISMWFKVVYMLSIIVAFIFTTEGVEDKTKFDEDLKQVKSYI